jgi:hypothetical protein
MACDRPLLAGLNERAGPWVPTGAMPPPPPPPPLPWDAPPLFALQEGATAAGRCGTAAAAARRRSGAAMHSSWDGQPLRGGQQARLGAAGMPAAAELAGALVGPHLPPGGWRNMGAAARPGGDEWGAGSGLPQIAKGHTPAVSHRPTQSQRPTREG